MPVVKRIFGSADTLPPGLERSGPARSGQTRRLLAALLVATSGLVSACASPTDNVVTSSVGNDYRTRHPIVVSQSEIAEDIVVSFNASQLSPRDRDVSVDFARRFKRSGANSLAIMIPSGSRNEAAAKRIALQVTQVLQDNGVTERQIYIHHYQAAEYGESATLRLVFADMKADVASQCGQWDTNLVENGDNQNYSNFGCATQKNLAAMIANPADLLGPRGVTEIDSTRRTAVINDWQENGSGSLPTLFGN
ncbi:MAG: CpaD family pilus assembly protein [Nitratireductor sp.]|nr:CpaD family pilus assembly protein [Nitratireductor sp.]